MAASSFSTQWHDFFVTVGGASAALTGLVFVAMSLNLDVIARDATHEIRAIATLTGFASAFAISALALLGGESRAYVAIEWLVISSLATAVYLGGYFQGQRRGGSSFGLQPARLFIGTVSYVAQVVGSAIFVSGPLFGLYVASVAMISQICFAISGAWLLVLSARSKS